MGVKVPDGQRLHVGEHLVADALLGALGDAGCEQALNEHGHDTGGKGGGHLENDGKKTGKVGVLDQKQGLDVVVDDGFQERHAHHTGNGGNDDADQDHDQLPAVGLEILQQALDNAHVQGLEIDLAVGGSFGCGRHQASSFLV